MHTPLRLLAAAGVIASTAFLTIPAGALETVPTDGAEASRAMNVQLGPRPYYLIDRMKPGALKRKLQQCSATKPRSTRFSIGHRGAALQFPEHTEESYRASARMGAGMVECDVTFTKDGELVCRHSQCDLHTSTNILSTPLANTCEAGFQPATFNAKGDRITPASAKCCTSALTLKQFKSLKGKVDGANLDATTVEEYMDGTADFRTDLYSTGGTLMSHRESIRLFRSLGVDMIPELKSPDSQVGFGKSGLTQQTFAAKMIREYMRAGVSPKNVWPQSFLIDDVLYWIEKFPSFGRQAVYLDGTGTAGSDENPPSVRAFRDLRRQGVNVISPPFLFLLTLDGNDKIVPSVYARNARRSGIKVTTWTVENSGRIAEDVLNGNPAYYSTILDGLEGDGDVMAIIDILARKVGVVGIFSDWPATTTYYANCMGLK